LLTCVFLRWKPSGTRYRFQRNDDGTFRPLILYRYKNEGKIPRVSPSAQSDESDRETAIVTVDDSNDLQILSACGPPARLDLARNQANEYFFVARLAARVSCSASGVWRSRISSIRDNARYRRLITAISSQQMKWNFLLKMRGRWRSAMLRCRRTKIYP